MLSTSVTRQLVAFMAFMFLIGARLEGQTLDLVKIGQVFAGDPTAATCGEYFVSFESPNLFPEGPRVWVEVSTPGRVTTLLLRRDQIKTVIAGVLTPEAEVRTAKGTALVVNPQRLTNVLQPKDITRVTIRLNQADYHLSSECLPPPE